MTVFMIQIPAPPENASIEPTDRSIPPLMMTSVIPSAMMPTADPIAGKC